MSSGRSFAQDSQRPHLLVLMSLCNPLPLSRLGLLTHFYRTEYSRSVSVSLARVVYRKTVAAILSVLPLCQ